MGDLRKYVSSGFLHLIIYSELTAVLSRHEKFSFMPCISPRIIINPLYIKSTHVYSHLVGFSKVFYISRGVFDYQYFSCRARKIQLSDLDKYSAYDPLTGDSIPVYISVPCGHCDACRLSKRFNLRNRMILEQVGRKTPMYFVTLTYDDKHLPSDGVSVRDCQLFLKRFRERLQKQFGFTDRLRYILFSEYGKLHNRPHYHFILYGIDFDFISKKLHEVEAWLQGHAWLNGFTRVMACDCGAFNYVSKYVLKGSNVPSGKNKNFSLASRGIGGIGCYSLSVPNVVRQIADGATVLSVNVFGKCFDVPVPKQIINYCYRNNIQSLRRQFLSYVKLYFHCSSALSNLYRLKTLDYWTRNSIDFWVDLFKNTFGFSLLEPQKVVDVAPYAPEYAYYANESTSNTVTALEIDNYADCAMRAMIYLTSFNLEDYPTYLNNSDLLSKFALNLQNKMRTLYGDRVDFSSDAPFYSCNLGRALADMCRDCQ